MIPERTVEFLIPSRLGHEKIVVNGLAALAYHLDFSTERVDDLKTALAEAITNAIEHGNRLNFELDVTVLAHIKEEALVLDVIDQGKQPIPQLSAAPRPRSDNRGLGMFLIQNLVDEVKVFTHPHQNMLQMVLKRAN